MNARREVILCLGLAAVAWIGVRAIVNGHPLVALGLATVAALALMRLRGLWGRRRAP
jgi:hypothetical protein